jgi:hypothetical protein
MFASRTIGSLLKDGEIDDDQIARAVESGLAGEAVVAVGAYRVDAAAALAAHPGAGAIVANRDAGEDARKATVRAALVAAPA